MFILIYAIILVWAANSMVEYSAFNRAVLGSSPRQPIHAFSFKPINREFLFFGRG